MSIHESGEMYLETILKLSKTNTTVRSLDIAEEMNFSKPSVSVAMKSFREKGYITMDESGGISLTPEGMAIAEKYLETKYNTKKQKLFNYNIYCLCCIFGKNDSRTIFNAKKISN